MVVPAPGTVVVVHFPFSDLSQSKLRPAVVLADAERDDWVLCQVTSKPYTDVRAIEISPADFATGALRVVSYARPGKLFTANTRLMVGHEGLLTTDAFRRVIDAVITLLSKQYV